MIYSDKQLKLWYDKYVENKYLARVISEEHLLKIKKLGFEHNKDPFKNIKTDAFKLFDILITLKKKGFIMMRWWGKPKDQEEVINCTIKDLQNPFIDFTSEYKGIINYYLNLSGGAFVQTILIYTTEILMKKPPLTNDELKLIKKLNTWAKQKSNCKNKVIRIKASSKYFESAIFQRLKGQQEIECPLGSFEHFKKIINKNGIKTYLNYLNNKKLFHIRTITKIPANEIYSIENK